MAAAALLACALPSAAGAQAVIVNTAFDHPDPEGTCDPLPGDCTLREAITKTTAPEIHLPHDAYFLETQLEIGRSVTLRGVEDSLATINANAETQDRVITVGPGIDVRLFRLRIQGGNQEGGVGGGIFVPGDSSLVVTDSEVVSNVAVSGGGIWSDGPLTLVRTTVAFNAAVGDGSDLGRGGGIGLSATSAPATFTNTTFGANEAGGRGGGIFTQRSMTLRSVSIVDNVAPPRGPENIGKGAGIYQQFVAGQGMKTTATNTLLARNVNGACGGTEQFQIAASNSLLDEPLPSTTCNAPQIPSNRLVPDAMVGDELAENGGLTRTYELLMGSEAIDNGADCPADDQRGFPRYFEEVCDIGAHELGAENRTPDVSVFSDELTQPGCTVDHCTLRERVRTAEDDDVIVLGRGTYELTAGTPLDLDLFLDIEGQGPDATTIDANGTSRVGQVAGGASVGITGVTVTGGDAGAPDSAMSGQGGAFLVEEFGHLELVQTTLTGNVASATGGAVANYGSLEVRESTMSGNHVESDLDAYGGAIWSIAGGFGASIENSTFSGNTATGLRDARGGALYLGDSSTLTHVTITGNSAKEGSGLQVVGGGAQILATLVAGNDGPECGGEMTGLEVEDHNLADDTTCGFDQAGDRVVADARLAPLGDYGGPTRTHALYTGSPAIDGGDPSTCPAHDQRRVERAPGRCDIGAFEGSIEPPSPPQPGGGGGGTSQSAANQEEEPPPPVAGESVNAVPKRGTVRIRVPGTNRFVELSEGQSIPVGTVVDTTQGRVTLFAAGGQSADFYDGIFRLTQGKGAKPLTTLTLVEALSCPKAGRAIAAAKKKKRRLWGDGNGRFRTKGKHSAATVVGTKWLVEDRCTSTLTRVAKGRVSVRDFVKKKTVIVRAGKKYVARARG